MTEQLTEREAAKLVGRVDEQVAEEAKLVDELADLRRREAEVVESRLREGKQSRGPGSPAESLRRKREAAERRLVDIREFELPAARRIAADATEALRRARVVHASKQARSFDTPEAEAVQRIAVGFEEFLRGYAALVDAAEGREEMYEELERGDLLNGLDEAARWQLHRAFMSTVAPFPSSPAAAFEAIAEAVLDPHAGNPEYAEQLAQSHPTAAHFVELLADARDERVYRRCHLRLTDMRKATADYDSTTNDRAGRMAGTRR